jgi:hypothetical protein
LKISKKLKKIYNFLSRKSCWKIFQKKVFLKKSYKNFKLNRNLFSVRKEKLLKVIVSTWNDKCFNMTCIQTWDYMNHRIIAILYFLLLVLRSLFALVLETKISFFCRLKLNRKNIFFARHINRESYFWETIWRICIPIENIARKSPNLIKISQYYREYSIYDNIAKFSQYYSEILAIFF